MGTQVQGTGDGRNYVIRASTVEELVEWVVTIRSVVSTLKAA